MTFVPESRVDAVSRAVFAAGAGRIGQYTSCSFRSTGTGTFFGEAGTNPVVGQAGRLELAPEVRLEVVTADVRAEAVVKALREAHPYEEPAFDLVRLAAAVGPRLRARREVDAAPGSRHVGRVRRASGSIACCSWRARS